MGIDSPGMSALKAALMSQFEQLLDSTLLQLVTAVEAGLQPTLEFHKDVAAKLEERVAALDQLINREYVENMIETILDEKLDEKLDAKLPNAIDARMPDFEDEVVDIIRQTLDGARVEIKVD